MKEGKHIEKTILNKIKLNKIIRFKTFILAILTLFVVINIGLILAFLQDKDTANNMFSIVTNYNVTFDANTGSGEMGIQNISYNVGTNLTKNTYTKYSYLFKEWNTKADGTGTSYADEAEVTNIGDITLYAQWELQDIIAPNNVTITVDETNYNSIKITASGSDEFGIKYFDFSLDGGSTYPLANRKTIENPTSGSKSQEFTYTGLSDYTSYSLKVKAIDEAGNEAESDVTTAKTKLRITQATVGAIANQTYSGQAFTPEPTITYSGTTLIKDTDYTLTYSDNTNAGTAKVKITGIGQCVDETNKTFTINQKNISGLSMTVGPNSNLSESQKIYGERFSISYNASTKMSNVRITGAGGWEFLYIPISTVSGQSYTFTCDYKNLTGFNTLSSGSYGGIGLQACKNIPDDTDNLGNSNAIQTTYLPKAKNTTTRTYSLTFTATGSVTYIAFNFGMCSDSAPAQVEVGNFKMNNNWAYKYDGSAKKITEQIKNGDTILLLGDDYTLSYSNNTNAGTATVTATGKGNYTGTKSATFKINS